jgi:MoaA/NifB/PqqE/SkfB family radical SAM enzyme
MTRTLVNRLPRSAAILVRVAEYTNRSLTLPLVVFYPTSRCNSACVSCEWWRTSGDDDLSLVEVERLAESLVRLGTQVVLFSGGEPLLSPHVFSAASLFRERGMRLHLLTSGVLLHRHAPQVAATFERVIVSLDASNPTMYHAIRGVHALPTLERGVARLRELSREVPIMARATLHRYNYRELPMLIAHAHAMGLDGISFLAADVTSSAFGRTEAPRPEGLKLSPAEVSDFWAVIEHTIRTHRDDFASGFVAESPEQLRRLPQYYAALNGAERFPPVACNAPWMSVVIEANGNVRPCFFHRPISSIRQRSLSDIIATHLPAFRHALRVSSDEICQRCVCSVRTSWTGGPWQ